jgi:hypothetical protein
LCQKGVIDERDGRWAAAEAKPLAEHPADFAAALRARGDTKKHEGLTQSRAARVLALAKAGRVGELAPSRVQLALADLRAEGRSLATCNHYLLAVKSLTRWPWRDGRA